MTTTVTSTGITFNNATTLETAGVTWTSTVATTSGTAFDFTGIPSGMNIIYVGFNEVGLNGSSDNFLIQLGDSGGIETTGYISSSEWSGGGASSTSGFVIRVLGSTRNASGLYTFARMTGNQWVGQSCMSLAGTEPVKSAGWKSLSSTLTQLRVTRSATAGFDSGSISIGYSK